MILEINEKYKSILDSDNSIFYCNKEFIKIEDYFLRGFYDDKESFILDCQLKKTKPTLTRFQVLQK